MRTFVALNLPAAERERLYGALQPLRGRGLAVRWVKPDALHLTLRFLGETEPAAIDRLVDGLRAVAARYAPVTLQLAGLGAFPSLRRAAVIWVGVDGGEALHALRVDTEAAIMRLGLPPERRPFRPHVTVGRARSGTRPPDLAAGAHHGYTGTVTVTTIDLMRSHTDPGGARYEALARAPLAADA